MNNKRFIESVAILEHLYSISEEREVLLLISRDFHLRSCLHAVTVPFERNFCAALLCAVVHRHYQDTKSS